MQELQFRWTWNLDSKKDFPLATVQYVLRIYRAHNRIFRHLTVKISTLLLLLFISDTFLCHTFWDFDVWGVCALDLNIISGQCSPLNRRFLPQSSIIDRFCNEIERDLRDCRTAGNRRKMGMNWELKSNKYNRIYI